ETLWNAAFPSGSLQERRWHALAVIAQLGTDWIEELLPIAAERPWGSRHRLLFPRPDSAR
ncbi:MAG: hypothetical protein AAF517_09825, partial [Planctomycetota bacterium]